MMTIVMRKVCLRPTRSPKPSEHQRTEGTHGEAGRESQEREDETGGFVHAGEELLGDDRRERAVQIEVVPLEDRAQTRRKR